MAKTYKIALIPGDGTGPEVVKEAVKVINAAAAKGGFKLVTVQTGIDRASGWQGVLGTGNGCDSFWRQFQRKARRFLGTRDDGSGKGIPAHRIGCGQMIGIHPLMGLTVPG